MLTLLTSEEFETWFHALGDAEAEEVAVGLELVEALGPAQAPPNSSELLLWFQSPSGNAGIDRRDIPEFFRFATRLRGALTHLESAAVQHKLGELSAERAERVSRAIASIRAKAHGWRHGYGPRAEHARREVESRYREILDAVGVGVPDDDPPGDGLRELNFLQCKPGLRVLYGVDATSQRALAILGEPLDRMAYGPSVRRAIALWRRFLASDVDVRSPALQARSDR